MSEGTKVHPASSLPYCLFPHVPCLTIASLLQVLKDPSPGSAKMHPASSLPYYPFPHVPCLTALQLSPPPSPTQVLKDITPSPGSSKVHPASPLPHAPSPYPLFTTIPPPPPPVPTGPLPQVLKDVTPSSWLYQEDLVLVHLHRAMGSNWPRCTAQLLPWLAAVRKRNPVCRATPQASPEPRQRGEGLGRGQGQGQEEDEGLGRGQGQGQEEEQDRGLGQGQEEERQGRGRGGAEGVAGKGGAEEEGAGGDGAGGEATEDRRRSLSRKHGTRGLSREGMGLGSAMSRGLGSVVGKGAQRAEGEGAMTAGRGRVGPMASLRIVKRQLDERWRCVLEAEGAVRYQVRVGGVGKGCGQRCVW